MRGGGASARWGSAGTTPRSLSTGSSPRGSEVPPGSEDGEELVEVTLDLQDDDTIVLRSVEPAAAGQAQAASLGALRLPAHADGGGAASSSSSRSPSMRRTSSYRLLQFSQELKAEAMARARQFSQDLTRRFSRSHSRDESHSHHQHQPQPPSSGIESALAARAARRQRAQLDRTRSGAHRALRGLRFISTNKASNAWREVQDNFDRLARDGYLARSDFAECIGMTESKEFALELFDTLSRRRMMKVDTINKEELREIWQQITDNSFDSRLQIFFDMVDKNADGRIGEEEVKEIIMLSASANKLSRLKEQAEEYAALIMEELDPEELGYIELWQLETLLLQKDTYVNYSQALSHTSQALSQNLALRKRGSIRKISNTLSYYLEDNWKRLWVLALWIAIMAALFTWKFMQYRDRYVFNVMGYCVMTAKGAAETLKLNMAIILLPVCRNTITWLRNTRAARVLPFDDNINFHKRPKAKNRFASPSLRAAEARTNPSPLPRPTLVPLPPSSARAAGQSSGGAGGGGFALTRRVAPVAGRGKLRRAVHLGRGRQGPSWRRPARSSGAASCSSRRQRVVGCSAVLLRWRQGPNLSDLRRRRRLTPHQGPSFDRRLSGRTGTRPGWRLAELTSDGGAPALGPDRAHTGLIRAGWALLSGWFQGRPGGLGAHPSAR